MTKPSWIKYRLNLLPAQIPPALSFHTKALTAIFQTAKTLLFSL